MREIDRLHKLHETKRLPEILLLLRSTGEIDIPLSTLRSWFYRQRSPSSKNIERLYKALDKIEVKPKAMVIAIRVTHGDPDSIYVRGMKCGTASLFGEEIDIENYKLDKKSNLVLYRNLHQLLSKYQNEWLNIS